MNHRQYLYFSRLAPGALPADVSDIVRGSRARNAAQGITGLLLFNGDAFCQFIEGPEPAVSALVGLLESDLRHRDLRVLHDDTGAAHRRMPMWSLGYAYDECAFDRVASARGLAALDAFQALASAADLGDKTR